MSCPARTAAAAAISTCTIRGQEATAVPQPCIDIRRASRAGMLGYLETLDGRPGLAARSRPSECGGDPGLTARVRELEQLRQEVAGEDQRRADREYQRRRAQLRK